MNKNIVLIGMMGTAKTSVGRALAAKTGRVFWDSDDLFAAGHGEISEFFKRYGEAAFRAEESKILDELALRTGAVISCGGGAVLNEGSMSRLKERGVVVLLTATASTVYRRVKDDNSRPLLQGGDLLQNIEKLQRERDPLYKKYADYTVATDQITVEQAADEIIGLTGALS